MRDRAPFLLFRASAMALALASEILAPMALSVRQAGILTMVTELKPMTQKDPLAPCGLRVFRGWSAERSVSRAPRGCGR